MERPHPSALSPPLPWQASLAELHAHRLHARARAATHGSVSHTQVQPPYVGPWLRVFSLQRLVPSEEPALTHPRASEYAHGEGTALGALGTLGTRGTQQEA